MSNTKLSRPGSSRSTTTAPAIGKPVQHHHGGRVAGVELGRTGVTALADAAVAELFGLVVVVAKALLH